MRGHLRRWEVKDKKTGTYVERDKRGLAKGDHSWSIVVSRKWHRFHGTRKQAEQKLTELVGKSDQNQLIEPSKQTMAAYLDDWWTTSVKPWRAPNTSVQYASVIKNHLKPALGHLKLQQLNVRHIDHYYAELKLKVSSATVMIHPQDIERCTQLGC